jgi:glycosyltransferase involved in cell wall biosynthesis
MWQDIAQVDPACELHVAYGWQNIDKSIGSGWDRDGSMQRLKADCEALMAAQPSVKWRGRLGQDELAKLYQESYAWLYPTSFLEVSCISAMEAMAGGAVPITSAAGALPETIGQGGAIITGNTYSQAWTEYYVAVARGVLQDRGLRFDYINKGNEQVAGLSWDNAYQNHWTPLVASLLEGKKEEVLV